MEMERFKFSAQVFGYVPKQMKKRLIDLREIDPKRFSESRIIEDALDAFLPQVEAKASTFRKPTQGAPGRKKTAA